jgi:hypothetical protein
MDTGVTWERVEGIYLTQNSDQSSDVVGKVVNDQGLQNAPQFLTGCAPIGISRWAVLHGISLRAFGLTCTVQNKVTT